MVPACPTGPFEAPVRKCGCPGLRTRRLCLCKGPAWRRQPRACPWRAELEHGPRVLGATHSQKGAGPALRTDGFSYTPALLAEHRVGTESYADEGAHGPAPPVPNRTSSNAVPSRDETGETCVEGSRRESGLWLPPCTRWGLGGVGSTARLPMPRSQACPEGPGPFTGGSVRMSL